MTPPRAILLKNGRIIDPANRMDKKASLLVEKGKIQAIFSSRQKAPVLTILKVLKA